MGPSPRPDRQRQFRTGNTGGPLPCLTFHKKEGAEGLDDADRHTEPAPRRDRQWEFDPVQAGQNTHSTRLLPGGDTPQLRHGLHKEERR